MFTRVPIRSTLKVLIALAASASLIPGSAALAQPEEEEEEVTGVVGTWHGKTGFLEQDNLVVRDTVFDVVDQDHRRFSGSMLIDQTEFTLAGTASASDVVSTVGRDAADRFGRSQGLYELEEFPDGAAVLRGRVRIKGVEGESRDTSRQSQIALRQFSFDPRTDPAPPAVGGEWTGKLVSDLDGTEQPVAASFENASPARFVGSLSYIEQDNLWILDGTSNPGGALVFIAIGDGPVRAEPEHAEPEHGVIAVIEAQHIVEENDVIITGRYREYSIVEENDVIDSGTFELNAVPTVE